MVDGYYVRPDFAYHTGGMDVAVFIDGPVHDTDHQQEKDEQARMKLEDEAGWMVLRFHHDDADDGWLHDHRRPTADVFGPGDGRRMTVDRLPRRHPGPRPRPRLARAARRPRRACCWSARSAAATTKPPCCCPRSTRRAAPSSTHPPSTTAATPAGPGCCATRCGCRFAPAAARSAPSRTCRVTPRNYQLVPLMMAPPRTPRGC